jgi:hypothetical protein
MTKNLQIVILIPLSIKIVVKEGVRISPLRRPVCTFRSGRVFFKSQNEQTFWQGKRI